MLNPFAADVALSRQLYGVNWCSEVSEDRFKRSEALAGAVTRLYARRAALSAALPVVRSEPVLVRAVKSRLRDELHARLTLSTLACELGVTPFVLLRAFARGAGLSPHAFQQQDRVRSSMPLLRAGGAIADVSARMGFADQPHFTRVFKQQIGVTPKVYRVAFS
ncbi:AraC family transcriptional regulator [Caballeronia sp. LZ035]|uniref:helix-turn-helix transcriptional regulator n=1 Tax=Caballeronia sp. LZ035 TaxID=3038568 RepID=UPI002856960E|nr:AraC family transcriptional regulator [Caballeronia sp. LZ035]MDR5763232.1 AraC family transcriptional regulator [Caballeronia sp. LZ035]